MERVKSSMNRINSIEPAQEGLESGNIKSLSKPRFNFYQRVLEKLLSIPQTDSRKDFHFRDYTSARIMMQREYHLSKLETKRVWMDMRDLGMLVFGKRGLLILEGLDG